MKLIRVVFAEGGAAATVYLFIDGHPIVAATMFVATIVTLIDYAKEVRP